MENNWEKISRPERGHDVEMIIELIRHAEKDGIDGEATKEGLQIAREYGKGLNAKVYHSDILRAKQTAKAIAENSAYKPREKKGLIGQFSDEFLEKYRAVIGEHKGDESASLQMYLDSNDERPDAKTQSSKEISRQLADIISHFVDVSERLKNNSRVNAILVSHSGTVEHLIVDLLGEDRDGFAERSGGGLKFLEGVKFIVKRNGNGIAHIELEFRGKKREISLDILKNI